MLMFVYIHNKAVLEFVVFRTLEAVSLGFYQIEKKLFTLEFNEK